MPYNKTVDFNSEFNFPAQHLTPLSDIWKWKWIKEDHDVGKWLVMPSTPWVAVAQEQVIH